MSEYKDWKKVWEWMNTKGFDISDDGLTDREPFADHNYGDVAALMIEYSESQLQAERENVKELMANAEFLNDKLLEEREEAACFYKEIKNVCWMWENTINNRKPPPITTGEHTIGSGKTYTSEPPARENLC